MRRPRLTSNSVVCVLLLAGLILPPAAVDAIWFGNAMDWADESIQRIQDLFDNSRQLSQRCKDHINYLYLSDTPQLEPPDCEMISTEESMEFLSEDGKCDEDEYEKIKDKICESDFFESSEGKSRAGSVHTQVYALVVGCLHILLVFYQIIVA